MACRGLCVVHCGRGSRAHEGAGTRSVTGKSPDRLWCRSAAVLGCFGVMKRQEMSQY